MQRFFNWNATAEENFVGKALRKFSLQENNEWKLGQFFVF